MADRVFTTSSRLKGIVGQSETFGDFNPLAGFPWIHFLFWENRKNARRRSSFFALERGPSFH
jgi:hypothetical protein